MIGKLSGKVDSSFDDHAIIDVSGVGYLVFASAKTLHKLAPGQSCQLFIETHVREDHIHLFGFLSLDEKAFFTLLQSVSGIGPRMALTILSNLAPDQIQLAVSAKDKEAFRAISGVGPKLAERILIELKDKIMTGLGSSAEMNLSSGNNSGIGLAQDAISALVNLGVNRVEAHNSVAVIITKNPDISINELIKLALKSRGE